MQYLDLQTLSIRFQGLCTLLTALIPPAELHRAALALTPQEQSDLALGGLLSLERLAEVRQQLDLLPRELEALQAPDTTVYDDSTAGHVLNKAPA